MFLQVEQVIKPAFEYYGGLALSIIILVAIVISLFKYVRKKDKEESDSRKEMWEIHREDQKNNSDKLEKIAEKYDKTLENNTAIVSSLRTLIESIARKP